MAAALLTLAACEEKPAGNPGGGQPGAADEISLNPESAMFFKDGGSKQVMITSSGEWTMKPEASYDWISASAENGQDGDVVKFTAKENYSGQQKTAVFVFTCGKAEAKFTAVSESGVQNSLSIVSEKSLDLKYNHTESIIVELNTNLNYRDVKVTIPEDAKTWCKFNTALEGDEPNKVKLVFQLEQNDGDNVRSTEITLSGERVEPVSLKISQRAQTKISTDKEEYAFDPEGGKIEVKVTANVKYKFEVTEGSDWVKHSHKAEGVEELTAGASSTNRKAMVKITETEPFPGDQPLVLEIPVRQVTKSLVSKAVDMTNFRMRPSWEEGTKGAKFENFTIELLLRADELTKQISSVFGIEGYLLVRCGDVGVSPNHIHVAGSQVAANSNGMGGYLGGENVKIINNNMQLETKKWYHVALTMETYDGGMFAARSLVRVYIDGEEVHHGLTYNSPFDLASHLGNSWDPWTPVHRFWFGYSWDNARDFRGKMTEIRLWNKALKSADLKAENHFYNVDPKSEGLVAYWKCNEAKLVDVESTRSYCIPDETGNGYSMICETLDTASDQWSNKTAPKLVDVSLP